MKTKYNVDDVVYIKAVVERVSIYTDNKGAVITEYHVRTPEATGRINDTVFIKEENVYAGHETERTEE